MSLVKKVQDGGGDSLPADEAGDQIKSNRIAKSSAQHHKTDPYEGPSQKPHENVTLRGEELSGSCPHTEGETKERTSHSRPIKREPHRRHEDQRHLLQFDCLNEVEQAKRNPENNILPPILTDCFSDEEMESSPLIEDNGNEIRLKRQQQYREELSQQINQREEMRAQQHAKKKARATKRLDETAVTAAAASAVRGSRSTVESYENQLRMEQMDEMRRQLAIQREREVQRLRRIYRKDDRKFLAHLHRLKLQESDPSGQGEGDADAGEETRQIASTTPLAADLHKKLELKQEASKHESTDAKPEVSPAKVTSQKVQSKKSEKKEKDDHIGKQQSSTTSTLRVAEKSLDKPLTLKRAYLRLQQQRREEESLLEERRAKAEAWRADIARQERLQRDIRNMADWRSGHSLAGVPLAPISSAQRSRFEAAASWLEKQRAAEQGKRIERDRQLLSWRDEKDRLSKERRMKEKAEEKVAREMQNERRKEAEKSFQRWILEIRARKASERASIPRGAIGVSTYTSAYSLPLPWRSPPKRVWRGKNCTAASSNGGGNGNVTHTVL